jgi:hypothetical protein
VARNSIFTARSSTFPARNSNFVARNSLFTARISKYLARISTFPARISKYLARISTFPARISKYLARISTFPARISKYLARISTFPARNSKYLARNSTFPARISKYLARISTFPARISKYLARNSNFVARSSRLDKKKPSNLLFIGHTVLLSCSILTYFTFDFSQFLASSFIFYGITVYVTTQRDITNVNKFSLIERLFTEKLAMSREKGDQWKHITIVEESTKGIKVKCVYSRLCQRFLTISNDFYFG